MYTPVAFCSWHTLWKLLVSGDWKTLTFIFSGFEFVYSFNTLWHGCEEQHLASAAAIYNSKTTTAELTNTKCWNQFWNQNLVGKKK